jgi:predicted metal-dependent hydrolase
MAANECAWHEGVALFERGAYWECHEALEPLWLGASGLDKEFYGGVILLAAALHKARAMGNPRGGRRNYAKALARLAVVPDHYHGVKVRDLEASVQAALRRPGEQPPIPMQGGHEG